MFCNTIHINIVSPLRRGRARVALEVVEDSPSCQKRREALQYSRTVLLGQVSRAPRLLYCARPVLDCGYDRNERAEPRGEDGDRTS